MQYPIVNDCLRIYVDRKKLQIVLKVLLPVSVQKFHNSMVITPEEIGLMESQDADNNIIISDLTLSMIYPTQLKKICAIQGHIYMLVFHLCQEYAFITISMV